MSYEVELKFPLSDPARVRDDLLALGAVAGPEQREVDSYFKHPARSFAETDEALRIREIGPRAFMTYKGPKIDATTKTRIEIELEVLSTAHVGGETTAQATVEKGRDDASVSSAACELGDLLCHLGFACVGEVRKDREPLQLAWQGRDVRVTLDEVAELGHFIELELSCEAAQIEQSRQVLRSLADRLHLTGSERRSYLELLLEKTSTAADTPGNTEDWSER